MNERDIQEGFASYYYRRHPMLFPNILLPGFGWECDLLGLSKRGYITEYEIKTNRQDYMREFKMKQAKHLILSDQSATRMATPKKFWFMCPAHVIEIVPSYAGLIWVRAEPRKWEQARLTFETIVRAPVLLARKITGHEAMLILAKLSPRLWRHRDNERLLVRRLAEKRPAMELPEVAPEETDEATGTDNG